MILRKLKGIHASYHVDSILTLYVIIQKKKVFIRKTTLGLERHLTFKQFIVYENSKLINKLEV